MRVLHFIMMMFLSFGLVSAQDTLRKVVEYDVKMEDAAKLGIPWLQKYIMAAGSKVWIQVLLDDLAGGMLKGYGHFETNQYSLKPEWFVKSIKGDAYDTVYVIDPITFEERIEVAPVEAWDINRMTVIRVREEWSVEDNRLKLRRKRFAIMYQYSTTVNQYYALFWIDLP